MMKRRFFTGSAAMLTVISLAAQRAVVVKPGVEKITIGFGGYRLDGATPSQMFLSVLKADLNRSGYFTVTEGRAAIQVKGQAGSEKRIQANIYVHKTAGGQLLLNRSFRAPNDAVRRLAHRVADEIVRVVTGKPGMASGKIAMVGNRTGHKELYICDMDGENLRQITRDRSIVIEPRWTPAGKNLVYTSYKRGYPNLFLTGREEPLASYGGLNTGGSLSPDGASMVLILSVSGNPELYVKNLQTGRLIRLTKTRRGNEASPCWSPDGERIAYVSDTSGSPRIYIISRNGGSPHRLSSLGTENTAPDWGRNGRIVFCSRIGGKYGIMTANPDERTIRKLNNSGQADYEDPSWAPDGRHIVCSRTLNYRSSIYLLDTLTDSSISLISKTGDWYSPDCSPFNPQSEATKR